MESEWPNCPRYFKEQFDKLKYKFPGAEDIENNYSQSFQDMFVLTMLDGKKEGSIFGDWCRPTKSYQ